MDQESGISDSERSNATINNTTSKKEMSPLRARGFSYDEEHKKKTRLLSVWAPTTDNTLTDLIDKNDVTNVEEIATNVGQKIKRKSSAFGLLGTPRSPMKEGAAGFGDTDSGNKKSDALDLRDVDVGI